MIFNAFDDSLEDEKANQEAFERSQMMLSKQREQDGKMSFLNSLHEPTVDDEFPLVKPAMSMKNSHQKIVINHQFIKDTAAGGDGVAGKHAENKSVFEETYVHKPIEFIKAADYDDVSLATQLLKGKDEVSGD